MRSGEEKKWVEAPQSRNCNGHEGEERATNKQHGMCFVNENAKRFYAMQRLVKSEREKLELGTVKAFWFSRFHCPLNYACFPLEPHSHFIHEDLSMESRVDWAMDSRKNLERESCWLQPKNSPRTIVFDVWMITFELFRWSYEWCAANSVVFGVLEAICTARTHSFWYFFVYSCKLFWLVLKKNLFTLNLRENQRIRQCL